MKKFKDPTLILHFSSPNEYIFLNLCFFVNYFTKPSILQDSQLTHHLIVLLRYLFISNFLLLFACSNVIPECQIWFQFCYLLRYFTLCINQLLFHISFMRSSYLIFVLFFFFLAGPQLGRRIFIDSNQRIQFLYLQWPIITVQSFNLIEFFCDFLYLIVFVYHSNFQCQLIFVIKNSSKYFYISFLLNQQIFMFNPKHTISCFDGTLNGWNKQSPEKNYQVRQSNFLHQLQSNLNRYEDQNSKLSKHRYDMPQVRLPLLTNAKSNINIQIRKPNPKAPRFESELAHKKIPPLPLRMKTLMIYNIKENEQDEQERNIKKRKKSVINSDNKQKLRKKVVINFQRIKQVGANFLQFSDDKFFKETTTIQQKCKSVKLHFLGRNL